jgi:NAD(P)-dependent dehydrogenase (short-subunit alcohol dehydrogenase family)
MILITGTNRGLGLAMTERLLEIGHHIIAVVRRTSDKLQSLQDQYADALNWYTADVTDEPSVQEAMARITRDLGHIDILVNNSAVHLDPERLPLEQVEDFSVYARTYQVNAVGPLIVTKHALPLVRKGRAKLIVNVSSEAGSIGNAWRKGEYAYCMSKAALNMASQILQNDVREQGIKVLALHPGWFSSDMGGKEAPITPTDAAVDVVDMILKPYDLDGPVYYGPDGKVMPW